MANISFKLFIFLLPIFLFIFLVLIKINSQETYVFLIREDSLLEYSQTIFYLLASIISLIMVFQFHYSQNYIHAFLYVILTIGLLFIAIEEISWGQRIFDFDNPDYFTHNNVQNEVSLHNLSAIQPYLKIIYILIGLYGTLAWLIKLVLAKKLSKHNLLNFVIPAWYISLYFFMLFFIYTLLHYIRPVAVEYGLDGFRIGLFLKWRDEEFAELFLSMGFLIFVIDNYIRLNHNHKS